jgi:hypothetical protein
MQNTLPSHVRAPQMGRLLPLAQELQASLLVSARHTA